MTVRTMLAQRSVVEQGGSTKRAPAPPRLPVLVLASVLLPLALFLVLQPETFGVLPNGLDHFFYTGLGMNFDDAVRIGENHYFISRWSAWYPPYLANALVGPIVGRLLLRLMMVAGLLLGLWRIRPHWTWAQRILVSTVLITMPMFLRPLLTDYVEYAFVTYGMGLVLLALSERQTVTTAAAAGVLSALLVVANPFTITMIGPLLAVLLVLQTSGLGRRVGYALLVVGTATLVLLGGVLWFRWVHDVADIYGPTIDFLRSPPGRDPLKSPRLEWLSHFTWLWIPPVVASVGGLVSWRRSPRLDRTERIALGLALTQYLVQWADQFLRDGNGLEISYYWSLSYPTLGIAVALVVGRMTDGIRQRWLVIATAGWLALLVVGVPDQLRLPAGVGLAVAIVVVLAIIGASLRRYPVAAIGVFLAFVAWAQIGAPAYDPLGYHIYNASPAYDRLFWSDGDQSEDLYRETLWFAAEMDQIDHDELTLFLPAGEWASPIVGIYQAHVGERVVTFDEAGRLYPEHRFALMANQLPWLAVYGPPDLVQSQLDTTVTELGLGPSVLDVSHTGGKGYRLVIVPLPKTPPLPLVMEAGELPTVVGVVDGDDVVTSEAGFTTYGPYVALAPGRYTITVEYRSDAPPTRTVGTLDVFSGTSDVVAEAPLPGTDGLATDVQLAFEITTEGDAWEFRTRAAGRDEVVIDRLILDE